MIRYGFLAFAGFMIMGVGVMNGTGAWMVLIMAPVLVGLGLGWNRLLLAGALAYAGFRVYIGELAWFDAAYAVGWAMIVIGSNVRCPRCGLSVGISDGIWRHSLVPHHCIACGRTRRDVWPFQYLVKPEPWDGTYHDEGGGPPREGFRADVIRRDAHDRWKKKSP
jgi:hypothetical protein